MALFDVVHCSAGDQSWVSKSPWEAERHQLGSLQKIIQIFFNLISLSLFVSLWCGVDHYRTVLQFLSFFTACKILACFLITVGLLVYLQEYTQMEPSQTFQKSHLRNQTNVPHFYTSVLCTSKSQVKSSLGEADNTALGPWTYSIGYNMTKMCLTLR